MGRDKRSKIRAAATLVERDRELIDQSRALISKSIELLNRTVSTSQPQAAPDDPSQFDAPLEVISRTGKIVALRSISDLIAFLRQNQLRWTPLRDEVIIAAAMPTRERTRAVRAIAAGAFRASRLLAGRE